MVYHVFNPTTGQHIDALTLEDAMRLRQEMIDEFVKSSLLLFSIIEETVANTGESSTRTVDVLFAPELPRPDPTASYDWSGIQQLVQPIQQQDPQVTKFVELVS